MNDQISAVVPNAPSPTVFEQIEGGIAGQVSDWWEGSTELENGIAGAAVKLASEEAGALSDFFGAIATTLKESPHAVAYVVGAVTLYWGYGVYKKWRKGKL